jgi:hypothetical protein
MNSLVIDTRAMTPNMTKAMLGGMTGGQLEHEVIGEARRCAALAHRGVWFPHHAPGEIAIEQDALIAHRDDGKRNAFDGGGNASALIMMPPARVSSSIIGITTPSLNFPVSFRAESISAFCAGESSRKRAIFSTSSGGTPRQIHHSIMFNIGSAALGKLPMFCVASQYQAPSSRHIS